MDEKAPEPGFSEKIGYSIGTIIGFAIIFALGIFALWVTMEPYH